MKKLTIGLLAISLAMGSACNSGSKTNDAPTEPKSAHEIRGYDTEIAWGEHLVIISGCDDCHSPKMMTDQGPVPNPETRLSGHPAAEPVPTVDRGMIEENGLALTNSHLTAWIGPWGVSFTANLTPDPTGLGNWSKEQFITALRHGKFKGNMEGRTLLPPMPWFNYAQFTDDEMSAVFAFLQSIPPIDNLVPAPMPPTSAM